MEYRVDFSQEQWEVPLAGIRHRYRDQENIRMRLVEYDRSMPPHWCEKGHYGIVLEGIFEIEFDDRTERYKPGDGLFLPPGEKHRHRGRAVTEKVKIFFVEMTVSR
jgi:quercetin dioxygenase-like cupin family protein